MFYVPKISPGLFSSEFSQFLKIRCACDNPAPGSVDLAKKKPTNNNKKNNNDIEIH